MKSLFRSPARAAAIAATLAIAATASATVVRYLDMDEHVALSDLVIRARAGASFHTFLGADGRPRTEIPFTVQEVLEGAATVGSEVRVRQMRGEAPDGTFLSIPGDAVFEPNEEAILFLVTDPDGTAYLTALGQSKFAVKTGPGGPFVDRDLGGVAFYVGGKDAPIVPGVGEAPVPLPLFSQVVRQAASIKGSVR